MIRHGMSPSFSQTLLKSVSISLTVFITLMPLVSQGANIYRWKDKHGILHFSEKAPRNIDNSLFTKSPIQQITLPKVTKSLKILTQSNSNSRKKSHRKTRIITNKTSRCDKIRSKIALIEIKLGKRQQAGVFDRLNQQLNQLQWSKIKQC